LAAIFILSVEQGDNPRESDQAKRKYGDDPKCNSLAFYALGLGTRRSGGTSSGRKIDAVKSERKQQKGCADENKPVRLKKTQKAE